MWLWLNWLGMMDAEALDPVTSIYVYAGYLCPLCVNVLMCAVCPICVSHKVRLYH